MIIMNNDLNFSFFNSMPYHYNNNSIIESWTLQYCVVFGVLLSLNYNSVLSKMFVVHNQSVQCTSILCI